MQLAQVAVDRVEARFVLDRDLTSDVRARLEAMVLANLPPGFAVTVVRVAEIARGAGGKFEDFVSELS